MRIGHFRFFIPLFILLFSAGYLAAQRGTIYGRVTDDLNQPIEGLNVEVIGTTVRTITNNEGKFTLVLEPGTYFIKLERAGYDIARREVILKPAASENLYVKMISTRMTDVVIEDGHNPKDIQDPDRAFLEILPLQPDKIIEMTSVKGDLTSRLATLGQGVSISNEFSSQYRVRGGNYDENLIYMNGIEIYRPFLVRTGQQEGLGFVNPQLVQEVGFSAGGFKAQYGDKMSSVLDVTYKTPTNLGGSVEMGVLNQSMHLEGMVVRKDSIWNEALREWEIKKDPLAGRLHLLFGARRFTPQYVLNSLDTRGDYKPVFYDAQGLATFVPRQKEHPTKYRERKNGTIDTIYTPGDRWKFSAFGNIALNNYIFEPQTRESTFGTIQRVFRLRVAFAGLEKMSYLTGIGAFTVDHRPSFRVKLRYIISGFRSIESETFDVEGGYWLSDVNTNLGSENFNDVIFDRGVGTFFRHGRNFLDATVLSAEQQGTWFPDKANRHKINWGLRWQGQYINDELKEWSGIDSAGYFKLDESYRNQSTINSFLIKGYLQDHWKISRDLSKRLVLGSRVIYNELNGELMFAPRLQFVIDPNSKEPLKNTPGLDESEYTRDLRRRRYQLRFAAGIYHQPTFYREMRAFDGTLHSQLPAQTSYHLIVGGDYLFTIWRRPFKLFGEAYYKYLDHLVPYEVENVRVRYYPEYTANGYAYGLDTRVTGEFIKGVDSWISIGLLRTQERIAGLNQGYVSRPADQRLNLGMYFEDELPINPTYKVHINFVYGSGQRFGPPRIVEQRTVFRVPSYQRVDLGFSKVFMLNPGGSENGKLKVESVWISAEIFNLFQRQNTISYTWIKDVYNTQFAVPNYLSARLLNLRVLVRF